MELDEIEDKLVKYNKMYRQGRTERKIYLISAGERGIVDTYNKIEYEQFPHLSGMALYLLNYYGFEEVSPCCEG